MGIVTIERVVARILIGAEQADLMRYRFADEGGERCGLDVRDHTRNHIAPAAGSADDRGFAGTDAASSAAAAALIPMPVLGQAPDERFIDLDNAAELINVLHESGSDFVAHEPSGFIGTEAHITIELQSAHAFLAGQHEVRNLEPVPQRFVGVLENRSGDVREAIGNPISAIHTFPLEGHCFEPIDVAASAARTADAFGPTARNEIDAARILVGEQFIELGGRQLVDWLWPFAAYHDALLSMKRIVS
jgi:hypothetical protein